MTVLIFVFLVTIRHAEEQPHRDSLQFRLAFLSDFPNRNLKKQRGELKHQTTTENIRFYSFLKEHISQFH